MFTCGNWVLVDVFAACGASWEGVPKFVAVAEAIVKIVVYAYVPRAVKVLSQSV